MKLICQVQKEFLKQSLLRWRLLYGCSSMQNGGLQNRKMRGQDLPPVPNAGSLPPVKARRRQNAIDQPERCKQSGKPIRSTARWQTATGLCEPEKVCNPGNLLVPTPLLTPLCIAKTKQRPQARAEYKYRESKKGETGTVETGRAGLGNF